MRALRWLVLLSAVVCLSAVALIASAEAQSYATIPVPVWNVTYDTYTALFIKEDYVVVFTLHGDIDLGYNYISVYPGSSAYIYALNGTQIKSLSGAGTYRLSDYAKVWDRSGFFSGNGRYLVEDPQYYGTGARVVDLTTGATRPIDFTGTAGGTYYYPSQLDYYGAYLAIGEGNGYTQGRLLLYKFNGTGYQKIWNSTAIGDIRRIAMTLDAKYIIYGALSNPYLYIAKKSDNDTVSVVSKIPLEGGVGALGITDLWNIGYILVGTDNGHIYIFDAKYKGSPENPNLVIYINNSTYPQGTGTTGRFYNPFYNRYNPPENIRLVAFSTNTNPYVSIIVDIQNKTFWRYSASGYGQATAISLQGNYLFAGKTLFTTVLPDVQSGNPRVRFSGTAYFNYGEKPYELSQPIVINADSKDYHVYFTGGSVKVTGVIAVSRPIELITDPDIRQGKLRVLADRGLIKTAKFVTQSGTVENQKLNVLSENTITYSATHKLQSIFYFDWLHISQGSIVDSGIVIRIPLNQPISPFEKINFSADIAIAGLAVDKDIWGSVTGVHGFELVSGSVSEVVAYGLLKSIGGEAGIIETAIDAIRSGSKVGIGSVALGTVGAFLVIDGVVGAYTQYTAAQSFKVAVMNAPIIEDTSTGTKYAVVVVLLPESEGPSADKYVNYITEYLKASGVSKVYPYFIFWGKDWDEYQDRLKRLSLPEINYASLVELAATNWGVEVKNLRIKEFNILIGGITTGSASLFDWLLGGLNVPIWIGVYGHGFEAVGVTRSFSTTDPYQIVTLVPTVRINDKVYTLSPASDGAIAQFMLPEGVNKLVVAFDSPYTATLRLDANVIVKKDFTLDRPGVYSTSFHYNWTTGTGDVLIRVNKIELVDMPAPATYIERTFIYAYGSFTHDVTQAFELVSSSGGKYYYVTKANTTFLDPANGATMQPCKTYVFKYYIVPKEQAGNAWVKVYFNGTLPTSTIPRQATVVVGSTGVSQTVVVNSTVSTFREDIVGGKPVFTLVATKTQSFTRSVPKNGNVTIEYDIQDFVAKAIDLMKQGNVSFVVVSAEIVKADANEIKSDDYDKVTWYPPSTVVTNKTVAFAVQVLDALTYAPLGATVVLKDSNGVVYDSKQTANGWANFSVYTGLYYVVIDKSGYKPFNASVNIYDNMTYTAYLIPENISLPIEGKNVTLTVKVYDASNGNAVPSANVTVNSTSKQTDVNGIASFTVKTGYVTVNVTKDGYLPYEATIYVYDNITYNVPLIPTAVTNYVILTVKTEYSDGSVASDVAVRIKNSTTGEIYFYGATNGLGIVTATIPKNYSVVVNATKNSWTEEKTVLADSNKTVKFVIPTSPPVPPSYAFIAAVVQYTDGAPVQGASVVIIDNITQSTIQSASTDGLGYARFVIPLYRVIDICASYGTEQIIPNCYRGETMNYSSKLYMFLVNRTSALFQPEVGIANISVNIHRGQGWFFGNISHLVIAEVYSNIDQTITLYVKLFNPNTGATISEATLSNIKVVRGLNMIWTWLDVNVTGNATDAQVYGKITAYQQDTDLRNNELYGNIVTFKPFLDMYPSITWKPVKQKIDTAILPGDVIEIDIAYVIPAGGIKDVRIAHSVVSYNLYKKTMDQIEGYTYSVSTLYPTTIYKNFTVVVPFTNKIVVNASIAHPLEDNALNNEMTLEIPVFEDTELVKVDVPLIVKAGEKTKVKVYLRSNAVGYSYRASVAKDNKETIGTYDFSITDPEMAVEVEVTPTVSGNKFFETQTWYVNLMGYDFYDANNAKTVTVTVWALPWWVWIILIVFIVLIVLLLVKKLLFTVRMFGGGEFKYFRRLDKGDGFGGDARLQAKIRELDEDVEKFRFFRRVR